MPLLCLSLDSIKNTFGNNIEMRFDINKNGWNYVGEFYIDSFDYFFM